MIAAGALFGVLAGVSVLAPAAGCASGNDPELTGSVGGPGPASASGGPGSSSSGEGGGGGDGAGGGGGLGGAGGSAGDAGGAGGSAGGAGGSAGSAGGNAGGAGGNAGGAGGEGGSSSGGGMGGAGGSGGGLGGGGAGGAGGPTGTALLLASAEKDVVGGEFHQGNPWMTASVVGVTADPPAVTLLSASSGLGVIRAAGGNQLQFATWNAGFWVPFAPIAPFITTRGRPAVVALNGAAHVIFQGDNYKHYHGVFQGGQWSPMDAPVGPAGAQSFGPNPAAAAAIEATGEVLIAFPGNDNGIYAQSFVGGAWQGASGFNQTDVTQTPAVAKLGAAGDALIVFVSGSQVRWVARTGGVAGVWGSPADVAMALSNTPPALAPVAGGAVLAFRGLNEKVYTSLFSSAAQTWSVPEAVGNFTTQKPPSVAAGLSGADAELAFVDSATGKAMHARLSNMAWSMPEVVGDGQSGAAIASAP